MISLRNRHFFFLDLLLLPTVAILAFILRLDTAQLFEYRTTLLVYLAISVPAKLVVFHFLGLYARLWRYASMDELVLIATAAGAGTLVVIGLVFGLAIPLGAIPHWPRSIPFIDGLLTLLVIGGPRFAVRRYYRKRLSSRQRKRLGGDERRVLVVGAGDAGAMIVKEMRDTPQLGFIPIGFIDDDRTKRGIRIHGTTVLGGRTQLLELAKEHDINEVVIAMPTAPGTVVREITSACLAAGIPTRTVPGLPEIISGEVSVSQLREVDIEDLLRRDPVRIDSSSVEKMLQDCRVVVTGAGGSIGSELCRQIARSKPALMILAGHGENSIFDIGKELHQAYPALPLYQSIVDLRHPDRIRQLLTDHRPDVVFHAAAHKHVPLMELNAAEAVSNNIHGTIELLRACEEHEVERFVFISTDKAVNPTSIMGATKRVAELLVQEAAKRTKKTYVSVRFGNVLGSRGSVVPIFRGQILRGGPVTVTDPEMKRYFMTIPEAVQLVLQAAALGNGGEVILLDMGEPVKIADLAKDLIELSGLELGRDIDIVYTGLRPGEKLFEELFVEGENYEPTHHEKLFVVKNHSDVRTYAVDLESSVKGLIELARNGDPEAIRKKLKEIVPEYQPPPDSP